MAYQDYASDLRNIAGHIEGMEEDYDNLTVELQEAENELAKAEEKIDELEAYIKWAEKFYPEMANQYGAICAVKGKEENQNDWK